MKLFGSRKAGSRGTQWASDAHSAHLTTRDSTLPLAYMDRLLNSKADDAVQSSEEALRQTEVYDEIREKTNTILPGRNQDSNNVDKKGKPAKKRVTG